MKRIFIVLVVILMMLSACSTPSDEKSDKEFNFRGHTFGESPEQAIEIEGREPVLGQRQASRGRQLRKLRRR